MSFAGARLDAVADLVELGAVLGDFFDQSGPSHDQFDQAFGMGSARMILALVAGPAKES